VRAFSFGVQNIGMKRILRTLAALAMAATALSALGQEPQTNLPRVKLSAGMHQIDAQVALTPEQREIGLMFRK
jgi:uncharacterized protein